MRRPPFDKPASFFKLFDAEKRKALLAAVMTVRGNAVISSPKA